MKLLFQIALGLFLGGVSMWWATQGVTWASLSDQLHSIRIFDAVMVAVLFMIQQFMRAYRQYLLLPKGTYKQQLMVLCIGFFFINTLPARLGEVVRPLLLKESVAVPLSSSFAMVFTERLLDLISAFVLALTFWTFANVEFFDPQWTAVITKGATFLLPLSLILLIGFFLLGERFLSFIPARIQPHIAPFFASATEQRKNLPSILLWTILIWGMTPLMFMVAGWSFDFELSYIDGIGVLGCTMLGMAAPNAPGFAGTYEAAFMAGLVLVGTTTPKAFAFAFVFHWWIYVVQSCSALFFMIQSNISFRDMMGKISQMRMSSKA